VSGCCRWDAPRAGGSTALKCRYTGRQLSRARAVTGSHSGSSSQVPPYVTLPSSTRSPTSCRPTAIRCHRTALATGKGLWELIASPFGRVWRCVIGILIPALIAANALNIAADPVASAPALLHAGSGSLWTLIGSGVVIALLVSGSFATIARVFKVLCGGTARLCGSPVLRPDPSSNIRL
jgi:hypothetical protein